MRLWCKKRAQSSYWKPVDETVALRLACRGFVMWLRACHSPRLVAAGPLQDETDRAGRFGDLGHQLGERLTQRGRIERPHRTPEDQAATCETLLLARQCLDLTEREA